MFYKYSVNTSKSVTLYITAHCFYSIYFHMFQNEIILGRSGSRCLIIGFGLRLYSRSGLRYKVLEHRHGSLERWIGLNG